LCFNTVLNVSVIFVIKFFIILFLVIIVINKY
jgi:hypothetical protein